LREGSSPPYRLIQNARPKPSTWRECAWKIDYFELLPDSVPVFSDDVVMKGQIPQTVLELKARVKVADAILICTPEYNYNPFVGKVSAQMGVSTGSQAQTSTATTWRRSVI
jgi:hypothetical protein